MRHSFGSDNHSGVAPEIMEAIVAENSGFQEAYGEDRATKEVEKLFKELFGEECESFLMFNGTATNCLVLKAMTQSHHAILAPATAHINVDECGAPEWFTGCKVVALEHENGKVTPAAVEAHFHSIGDQHRSQPKVLSISQPTELGTIYQPQEIEELAKVIHSIGGYLHMDGARIANAAAALKLPFKEFTVECGVDALSFGGTKNGMLMGEAALFFKKELADQFEYIRKQGGQLFSKGRFVAAQFKAYLGGELYLKLANHSNSMARYFKEQLQQFQEITVSRPVESNALFALLDPEVAKELRKEHLFYDWDLSTNEVRWVCSFNTQKEDIDLFIEHLKKALSKG